MKKIFYILLLTFVFANLFGQDLKMEYKNFQSLSYEQADAKADSFVNLMTMEELIAYVGGDKSFFIREIPRLNLREVYMTDATQGVHIRKKFNKFDLSKYQLTKSTAFPCPILLTSAWNRELTYSYAISIGEECRAGGIGILLGPGMNHYRHSQCGRNFEYFGEDPFLRSQLIAEYVKGVQSTGTVATLKHFVANNTEFYRRKSNSIIDERTLFEIYLPAFKSGIDAGATAVMTSYNLLNGEWAGQSEYVIKDLLRKQLGFRWLVMTDWWSVWDGEKVVKSGQDLEMPAAYALKDIKQLLDEGKIQLAEIKTMAKNILRTYFAMKLDERKPESEYNQTFAQHESIALQTVREGIVLLKNRNSILPLKQNIKSILVVGEYAGKIIGGGGSAEVKGYNHKILIDELKKEFGKKVIYQKKPSIKEIKKADIVICNIGTKDSEGWDRPFELHADQEKLARLCVENNPNTIVIVTTGSGVRMTDWNDKAAAIIYGWYVGQNGNIALTEIISGKTNPSGKLPISIEKEFKDSPGYDYIPKGEHLYSDWNDEAEKKHPVYDVKYSEGVFTGYRWYESKNIDPLYPFGFGLSYTTFEYSDLKISKEIFTAEDKITVELKVKNTGSVKGKEIVQLYVQDLESSIPRPLKELKGFIKIELESGEAKTVKFALDKSAFSFWYIEKHDWLAEAGEFNILIGASSKDIRLQKAVTLIDKMK